MEKTMKQYIQPETCLIHMAIMSVIADSFHEQEGDGQDAKASLFDDEELDTPENLWE